MNEYKPFPVLLIGGTAESAELIDSLADLAGPVLFSTATDESLALPENRACFCRITGRRDAEGLADLIREHGVRLLVCAVHPYAADARENALRAAETAGVPVLVYLRRASDFSPVNTDSTGTALPSEPEIDILYAQDHNEAARIAFSFQAPVLLTTGSRNLMPYAEESRRNGCPLYARMLDNPEAHAAADAAGIPQEYRITARGPFSEAENCTQIRQSGAKVLVSKDGGSAGGMPEKLAAVKQCGCRLVLVRRPEFTGESFSTITALTTRAREILLPA